jgi:predicted glutamine amidotransferase
MCGILGAINNYKINGLDLEKYIEQGLIINSLRGTDSTGIFVVEKDGTVNTYKKTIPGWDFWQLNYTREIMKDLNKDKSRFIVCHNRAATVGGTSLHTAHPINVGPIHLVHNGTLDRWATRDHYSHDSTYVAEKISQQKNEKEICKILSELEGSFSLIWYNENTKSLYMARNDERPLVLAYVKDEAGILFASEKEMIEWLISRNKISIDKYLDTQEYTLIKYDLESFETKTFKFTKPPVKIGYVAPYQPNSTPIIRVKQKFLAQYIETTNMWCGWDNASSNVHTFRRANSSGEAHWVVPAAKNMNFVKDRYYWLIAKHDKTTYNRYQPALARVLRRAKPTEISESFETRETSPAPFSIYSTVYATYPIGTTVEVLVEAISKSTAQTNRFHVRGSLTTDPSMPVRGFTSFQLEIGDIIKAKVSSIIDSSHDNTVYLIITDMYPSNSANYMACDSCKLVLPSTELTAFGEFMICESCKCSVLN